MKINIFLKFSLVFCAIALISISLNFLLANNRNEILAQGIWQVVEEKCLIDAEIKNGFEKGKIPIGEAVDYAELYAREIIRNLNVLIVNTEKAANTAYNEKSEDDLYDLPPQIKCSKCESASNHYKKDGEGECTISCAPKCLECDCCPSCGEKCPSSKCVIIGCSTKDTNKSKITSGKCNCNCLCNGKICASGSCTCTVDCSGSTGATDSCGCGVSQDFYHCPYTCSCPGVKPFCAPLCKFSSGVKIIQDVYYNKIVIANDNIAHLVDVEGLITLCNCPKIDLGFVGGEIEIPEQLNRWKIVNALTDSRNKLEICITGYQHVLDQGMLKATLLNCMTALDQIETEEGMTILPGFKYFAATSTLEYLCFQDLAPIGSDYCYAYNSLCFLTKEERAICRQNKDSKQCEKIIEDLMYNFFYCGGVVK